MSGCSFRYSQRGMHSKKALTILVQLAQKIFSYKGDLSKSWISKSYHKYRKRWKGKVPSPRWCFVWVAVLRRMMSLAANTTNPCCPTPRNRLARCPRSFTPFPSVPSPSISLTLLPDQFRVHYRLPPNYQLLSQRLT